MDIRHTARLSSQERIDGVDVRRLAMTLPGLAPSSLAGGPFAIIAAARRLLRIANAFPSRVEPFGIVVLEAIRAGCRSLYRREEAPEIVRDAIDGLVVDPVQTDALSTAIARLLTETELAQRLSNSGLVRAAKLDWRSVVARYSAVYQQFAA